MSKNPLKFFIRGLLIIAIGFGAVYAIQFWRQRTNPEYQVLQYFKDLERQYREDPYGGSTPEETLRLFIDALKKGDIDLAAKYFLIEEQKKEYSYLESLKKEDNLKRAIEDAEKLKLSKLEEERAFFTIANEKNIVEVQVVLNRLPNGRWKITEL